MIELTKGLLGTNSVAQIAVVVKDIDKACEDFSRLLGISKPNWFLTGTHSRSQVFYQGEPSDTQSKLVFIDTPSIQIELMEVNEEPSTMKDYLEKRGEGIHHVAFVVDKISKRLDSLNQNGYPLLQSGEFTSENKGRYTYLNTEDKHKTIVELLERETPQPKKVADLISEPLFGSRTITQIALVVENIDETARHFSHILGMGIPRKISEGHPDVTKVQYQGESTKADATFMSFKTPTVAIKLIQPGEASSSWRDYLNEQGEGIHHISFEVVNLKEKLKELNEKGYQTIQKGNFYNGNGRYVYLDTKEEFKVNIELLERYF